MEFCDLISLRYSQYCIYDIHLQIKRRKIVTKQTRDVRVNRFLFGNMFYEHDIVFTL